MVGKGTHNSHPSADPLPIKLDDEENKENHSHVPSNSRGLGPEEELMEEQVEASIAAQAERIAEETLVI